ncbi:MAG TPA: fumarylacetoacetase, partial [Gemmatimonadaceae bacterium]|nr:fumarylacetoacetase [Gemmatimonadaceae bacterium]
MAGVLNGTHDPALRSWVESANDPDTDFPIQNLPLGIFRREEGRPAVGVAIGDRILDLGTARASGMLAGLPRDVAVACEAETLNALMALPPGRWSAVRAGVSALLRAGGDEEARGRAAAARVLMPSADVELLVPAAIGDYTDFYASVHHATNVGRMFRPDNPLLPNYKWVPIGYHGRASSIVASGAPVRRPLGQTHDDTSDRPRFGPTATLDYECELGFFIGGENTLGTPVPIADAPRRLFGVCLVNDWSARDVQRWEYQPLGPFLAKSFATTVSPWVVTMEALAPFRAPAAPRPAGDPLPLPYLDDAADRAAGGIALVLEVALCTAGMRARGSPPAPVSRASFTDMYWTPAQMLAHHASNGCNLRPGDLFASGTVSGTSRESRGCLLELTGRGTEPLKLPGGEERRFLHDGDEVVMRGWCERPGFARIGLGECRGTVAPAPE